jgi:nucleotide-binding universal stress UspA family protein
MMRRSAGMLKCRGDCEDVMTPHPSDERPTNEASKLSPRKLLMVAVDASEQAIWAARVAAELAEPISAYVVLVHVLAASTIGASELAMPDREERAAMRRAADEVLDAARAQFPAAVPVQRLLREGDPAKEIVASAEEWEADLVVMGTHGRGRLATFVLGSTADAVIRSSPCPVVTVSHDPRGRPPANGPPAVRIRAIAL